MEGLLSERKPRALIIEDDYQLIALLEDVLQELGFDTLLAMDGQEGVDVYMSARPDLVLTDIVMPGKLGLDVIRELRMQNPGLGIVAMSGGGHHSKGSDMLSLALLLGVDAILRKPFTLGDIEEAVAQAMKAHTVS